MEGKNNTPSWVPQLLSALAVVASTWAMIREEVPGVVAAEVRAELATHRAAMVHHLDSVQAVADSILRVRIDTAVATITTQAGLVATNSNGRTVYSPRIVVPPDTAGLRRINARLDTLTDLVLQRSNVVVLPSTDPIPGSKRDRWNRRQR